jgi:hypothetical protein
MTYFYIFIFGNLKFEETNSISVLGIAKKIQKNLNSVLETKSAFDLSIWYL